MERGFGTIVGEPLQKIFSDTVAISTNDVFGQSNKRVLRTWRLPAGGGTDRDGTHEEMRILFDTLPTELSDHLRKKFPPHFLFNLNEIYLQLGQIPECVVCNKENDDRLERCKFCEFEKC